MGLILGYTLWFRARNHWSPGSPPGADPPETSDLLTQVSTRFLWLTLFGAFPGLAREQVPLKPPGTQIAPGTEKPQANLMPKSAGLLILPGAPRSPQEVPWAKGTHYRLARDPRNLQGESKAPCQSALVPVIRPPTEHGSDSLRNHIIRQKLHPGTSVTP